MVGQLQALFQKFDLMLHVVAFVKDEINNFISMAVTMRFIVGCHTLKLQQVYEATCFDHVMSKTCQYATNDDKVVIGLKHVSVKNVQTSLQKKNYINKKN